MFASPRCPGHRRTPSRRNARRPSACAPSPSRRRASVHLRKPVAWLRSDGVPEHRPSRGLLLGAAAATPSTRLMHVVPAVGGAARRRSQTSVKSDTRRDRPGHERHDAGEEAEAEKAVLAQARENRGERYEEPSRADGRHDPCPARAQFGWSPRSAETRRLRAASRTHRYGSSTGCHPSSSSRSDPKRRSQVRPHRSQTTRRERELRRQHRTGREAAATREVVSSPTALRTCGLSCRCVPAPVRANDR